MRVHGVHEQLAAVTTVAELADIVRTYARVAARADGATFIVREGDSCYYVDEDSMAPLWKGQRFPLTSCISGWAMLHDTAAVVPDIHVDDRIPQDAYRPTFVRSLLMVPVGRGRPVAAIGAYWARRHEATDGPGGSWPAGRRDRGVLGTPARGDRGGAGRRRDAGGRGGGGPPADRPGLHAILKV